MNSSKAEIHNKIHRLQQKRKICPNHLDEFPRLSVNAEFPISNQEKLMNFAKLPILQKDSRVRIIF